MKQLMVVAVALAVVAAVLGGCSNTQRAADTADAARRAHLYLQGVQAGDKEKMYQASGLTPQQVNESREKLIHPDKYKQTEQQRAEAEHLLRSSGNIDFIAAKFPKMLPKSATFQVVSTVDKGLSGGVRTIDHSIKITYSNKDEAMRDATGRAYRELTFHLLQISRAVNGSEAHNFSVESDKIADRKFEAPAYF